MNIYNNNLERNGDWVQYFGNGNLMFIGHYINGVADGYWERYYDNGQLYYSGNFVMGKPKGLIITFNPVSELIEKEFGL